MLFGFPFFLLLPIFLQVETTTYSIIYRALCVLLMFFLLFSAKTKSLKDDSITNSFILIMTFWILILLRILVDFEIKGFSKSSFIKLNPVQVYLFAFFLSLLPIVVLYLNRFRIRISDYNTQIINILILYGVVILFGLYLNYGQNVQKIFFERTELAYGAQTGFHPLNPISIGRAGAIILMVGLYYFLVNKNNKYIKNFLLICLGTTILLLGGSRGPVISVIIALVLILLLSRKHFNKFKFMLLVIVIVILAFQLNFQDELSVMKRFEASSYSAELSRTLIWKSAFEYFLISPLIGYSIIDKFGHYPHNIYLEALMSVGLLGSLPFFIILKKILSNIKYLLKSAELNVLDIMLLMYLLFVAASGSLYYTPELWVLISLNLFGFRGRQQIGR